MLPDQLLPLQVELLQVEPLQVLPLHVLAFHVPPDQVDAAASSAAMPGESNGMPKMSCSPLRTMPSRVRWSVPRESSTEPVPVETGHVCVATGSAAWSALPSWSSPPPIACDLSLIW